MFGAKFVVRKFYRWRHDNWPIGQWVIFHAAPDTAYVNHFFPAWICNIFQIHSGEKAALRLRRSLGFDRELLRGLLVASLIEASLTRIYNEGQTSCDTFAFLGHFPIRTGPTSPLTPQTMLDACIQIFSEFQLCVGWWKGELQENFE